MSMQPARNRSADARPEELLQRALATMRALRKRVEELESSSSEPIAIIGMACRFPGPARDLDSYWQVLEGSPAISGLEQRFDEETLRGAPTEAGLLPSITDFDAGIFGMAPKEAAALDPQQRLLLELSWEALENAGHAPTAPRAQPVGVFVGMASSDFRELLPASSEMLDAHHATGSMNCLAAGRIAFTFGFDGPAMVVDTACSSSLTAVHLGCQSIRQGESRLALAGGVNIIASPLGMRLGATLGALSPTGGCRPFDAAANGFIRGEGGGVVVLKRLRDALADRDQILAVVRGSAINQDGRSTNLTSPNVAAQIRVLQTALRNAGVDPSQLTYVEAHGTGTVLGDPIELEALREVLGVVDGPRCYVGSVKANIGHLEAAAGIAGLIKVVLSMRHRRIPRQEHFDDLNPHISLDGSRLEIPKQSIPWTAPDGRLVAGVSSFGISGTNVHAILEAPPPPVVVEPSIERGAHILALSARSSEALVEIARRLQARLTSMDAPPLGDACYTVNSGRSHFRHRAALVAGSGPEMASRLAQLAAGEQAAGALRGIAPPDAPPRVAFLFTGEGPQHGGMGRGLYESMPQVRRTLDTCDEILRPVLGSSLLEAMHQKGAGAELLRQTAYAQPAIFALEVAVARMWMSWGIEPTAVLGHGVGEYAAACIAGIFTLEDGLELVARRGALMQAQCEEGAMAAILADPARIEEELARFARRLPTDLAVAAVNGPGEVVVSGRPAALARLCASLEVQGMRIRVLPVARGFHSQLMAPILSALEDAAGEIAFATPRIPVVSNLTGRQVAGSELSTAAYWRAHAASPVLFGPGLRTLAGAGCTTLLEVGPGSSLIDLAREAGSDAGTAGFDRLLPSLQGGDELHSLLESLGAMYVDGAAVNWEAFDLDFGRQRVEMPTYPFRRKRLWFTPESSELAAGRPLVSAGAAANAAGPGLAEAPPAPRAQPAASGRDVASVQAAIRDAVAAVMRMEPGEVDTDVSFQAMGLDSLMALRLRNQIRDHLGVSVSLVAFLKGASVASLAAHVMELAPPEPAGQPVSTDHAPEQSGPADALPPIVPRPDERYLPFPLTDLQQAYVLGRSGAFELGNISTYFLMEFDLSNVDLSRLERAFRRLIDRHDMLRAVVLPDGTQRVLESVPAYDIEVTDLRSHDAESRERNLLAIRQRMFDRTVDGTSWPLFEVRVSRTAGDDVRLHIGLDALFIDGWSSSLLLREWSALYQEPRSDLPALSLTYRDYVRGVAALEQGAPFERALAYWQARVPTLPPPPDLPLARDPASIGTPRFVHRQARLDAASWSRFKQRAAEHGITPSAAVCTAYAEILAAWSSSSRFTLNLLALNRLPLHAQVPSIIGNFSTTTLLEVDAVPGEPFLEGARRLQTQLWSDLQHGLVNGVRVLRDLNRAQRAPARAAMPVVFASVLSFAGDAEGDRSVFRQLSGVGDDTRQVHCSVRTPQVWLDHQVAEDAGELILNWDSVDDLFPEGMIAEAFAAYVERLQQLAADPAAWDAPAEVVTPAQQLAVRAAANATAAPVREELLHQPFLDRLAEDAGRVAVVSARRTLTYGELDRMSERVAAWLQGQGARPGRLVAIVMEKGWEQVVAAVAVLKSGGAYVPVDAGLPRERLHHVIGHAEADCVLTQSHLDASIEWPDGVRRLPVDRSEELPDPISRVTSAAGPRDLAYVIYTSGSTGLPKGVMIEHRSALNTVLDVNARLGVGAPDRVLGLSSLSFDLSVHDIFGMLAAGGAVVLPAPEDAREPLRWLTQIVEHRVTLWNSVPALMEMLVDQLAMQRLDAPLPLRAVMMSGDWIPLSLPPRIAEAAPAAKLLSLGGATEASIWSIWYPIERIEPAWTSVPYGVPMRNQRFHVLDEAMRPRPVWVPGDLYIAGDGLARGYWRDEEKTASSFVDHPVTGERLYRTGDLGRYLPDGNIEFLGRADFQVKVGGYRIELGEIEAALGQLPGVRSAVAVAVGERGARRLVAYAAPESGAELSAEQILAGLREKIPAYAVPQQIHLLESMPLSANGKVDRRALPRPDQLSSSRSFVPARTGTEQALLGFWTELLGGGGATEAGAVVLGVNDNFFDLGGHSLLAVRLMGMIKQRWGVTLPLASLFDSPTIESLGRLIDRDAGGETAGRIPLVAMRRGGSRPPLFFIHPAGGDVLCYAELAAALGPDQPFYALQAVDPTDHSSPTVEEMAATYVAALREAQPCGPYRVGGWSMGGVVAYEVCQQLRRSDEVDQLTLLDVGMPPSGSRPDMDDAALLAAFARDLAGFSGRDIGIDEAHLRTLSEAERLPHVLERACATAVLTREIDVATLQSYFDRFRRNYRAMLAYQASPLDGPLLFLRARERGAAPEVARAWCDLSADSHAIDIDGDHFAVTRQEGARAVASLMTSSSLPPDAWPRATAAARKQSGHVAEELGLPSYRARWEALDRLTTMYVVRTLRRFEVFVEPGERHSPDDLLRERKILPTYRHLIARWLRMLAAEGLLRPAGDAFESPAPLPDLEPDDCWNQHRDLFADVPFLRDYVRGCGRMLTAVLTGKESPLETLFPDGSHAIAEGIYHTWPVSRHFNAVARAAVEGVLGAMPAHRPIRVIEVGAGTGGTTAAILPILPAGRSHYLYTDASEFFFGRAAELFADHPFVRYGVLDIEKSPAEQGYGAGAFDVVVAANVLHATRNLAEAIDHVASLLVPGGVLVLFETTRHPSWLDISVGLIEGWQRFEDDLRADNPVLSLEGWERALHAHGFDDLCAFPERGAPTEILPHHVIVARSRAKPAASPPLDGGTR